MVSPGQKEGTSGFSLHQHQQEEPGWPPSAGEVMPAATVIAGVTLAPPSAGISPINWGEATIQHFTGCYEPQGAPPTPMEDSQTPPPPQTPLSPSLLPVRTPPRPRRERHHRDSPGPVGLIYYCSKSSDIDRRGQHRAPPAAVPARGWRRNRWGTIQSEERRARRMHPRLKTVGEGTPPAPPEGRTSTAGRKNQYRAFPVRHLPAG